MGVFLDITGQKFNRLTVISRAPNQGTRAMWRCLCECGNTTITRATDLRTGRLKSCGCAQLDAVTQHGFCPRNGDRSLWLKWKNIRARCNNTNHYAYKDYGGRGIKLFAKWETNSESFIKYILSALGPKPTPQHSLDRIDNDKGYIPGNMRWATKREQSLNRRGYGANV